MHKVNPPSNLLPYRLQPRDGIRPGGPVNIEDEPQALEFDDLAAHDPLLGLSEGVVRSRIVRKPLPSTEIATAVEETNRENTQIHTKSNVLIVSQTLLVDPEGHEGSPIEKSEPGDASQERAISSHTRPHIRKNTWEIVFHILMGLSASAFLALALLSASVNYTYPGLRFKYVPGGPVLSLYGKIHGESIYPNGSVAQSYDMCNDSWGGSCYPEDLDSPLNLHLLQATKVAPTLFPIIFAAIFAGTIRLFARWKAEKKLSVETLELLVASRSLASTFTTMISSTRLGMVETGLVLLWLLSPLGGQISLRLLGTKDITDATIAPPWFVDDYTQMVYASNSSGELLVSKTIYTSSFIALGAASNTDRDGNLLVPFTEAVPWALGPDYFYWNVTQEALPPAGYTSLRGLHIRGHMPDSAAPDPTNSHYSKTLSEYYDVESVQYLADMIFPVKQFEFHCPSMTQAQVNGTWMSSLGMNSTRARAERGANSSGFFVDTHANSDPSFGSAQEFLFGSFLNAKVTLWKCYLKIATRNVSVGCWDYTSSDLANCEKVHNASIPSYSAITPFKDFDVTSKFLTQWPLIDAASPGSSSLTEQFIALGYNMTAYSFLEPLEVDLSKLDNVTFARRFTTIFNTYVQATQLKIDRDNPRASKLMLSLSGSTKSNSATPLYVKPFRVIACNWLFFTILLVLSLFLICCCGLNIWLLMRISTPDILGYVSTSTIENPYVLIPHTIPGAGSSMDGLERARLLKNMKVQIRDVQPEQEVGKYALTNVIQKQAKIDTRRSYI
ncbi:hypothetical protein VTL71DRAFT_11889 [Oculimacula yallundae]|uniref:Uncharacterized protein n=1 Tax=Oculimacula yallundae TaxID=86028 RepID=A0ABR4CSZ8_9HELO